MTKKAAILNALRDGVSNFDMDMKSAEVPDVKIDGEPVVIYAKPMTLKRQAAIQAQSESNQGPANFLLAIAQHCFCDSKGVRLFRTFKEARETFGNYPDHVLTDLVLALGLGEFEKADDAEENAGKD